MEAQSQPRQKRKNRKRLYAIKTGFQLVRDAGQTATYQEKHQDFLMYLWECCPSGILMEFQKWLSGALCQAGLDIRPEEIDLALSRVFMDMEKTRNENKKRRRGRRKNPN